MTRRHRHRCLTPLLGVVALAACGERSPSSEAATRAPEETRTPAGDGRTTTNEASVPTGPGTSGDPDTPKVRGDAGATLFVHTAVRCGECHVKMAHEWRDSAHARAATSPAYQALLASAPDAQACKRCHAPIELAAPTEPAAREGVTCDVCHTIDRVTTDDAGATFSLRLDDMVKYGPLCGLEDHYFHRMGCSSLHTEAELCGACHSWTRDGMPVYTEYIEWRDGPYGADGVPCQTCHMPGDRAEVAEGAGERDGVPHHGFIGRADDLRARAVEVKARASRAEAAVTVALTVTNVGAGHAVPSGFPGTQLVVRVRAREAGAEAALAEREHVFARVLVDVAGNEAPHYAAVRQASDNRIGPRQSATVELVLEVDSRATAFEVSVIHRALSPALARAAAIAAPAEQVLLEGTLALPAKRASAALHLRPAAPGRP